jgi:16S rRNA (guanine(966)-N(2))-methyltransferase RsmD
MAKRKYHVRVLSGALKGRLLEYPGERPLRPTMQRTKSSVFESLGATVRGAVAVDLYAAAGGIGIEALSRGAAFVHFVEKDHKVISCLRRNLHVCGIEAERARVHATDVFDFLEGSAFDAADADIIYADPPYGEADAIRLLELFDRRGLGEALLVLEHDKNIDVHAYGHLSLRKSRTFGQTRVSFLE